MSTPMEKRQARFEASKTAENPEGVYIDPKEDGTAVPRGAAAVDTDRIPNLIKIGEIPSSYGQSLITDIIDPTSISDSRCRFTLQRVAGFLHSNSKITLAVTPTQNARAYYPLNIGISSLIKSAELTIGGKTVCSVQDYNHFHTYHSLFVSNEDQKEREQFLSQRCINHQPIYHDRSVSTVDDPPNSAPKVGLDNGMNPTVAAGVGAFTLLPFQVNDGTNAQTVSEAPVYSVYLSDLFTFLKFNQIPAFMLGSEEIHIDLVFQDAVSSIAGTRQSIRMQVDNGAVVDTQYAIDQQQVKLVYDSIMFDGDIMTRYAQQNPTLSFQYVDYRLAKRTGPETAFANLTFPVGGNGRLVSKVIFGIQKHSNTISESLLGNNISYSVGAAGALTTNIRYNDRFEFSVDRSNKALLFSTTQQAEGLVPMVTRDEYARQGSGATSKNALTGDTFEGHAQSSSSAGLHGLFNWTAIKPNRGERVNNQGVDLVYKNTNMAAGDYTLRCYLELLKVATIKDGVFDCYFA